MRTRIPAIVLAGLLSGLPLTPAPVAAHSFLRDAEPAVGAAVARAPRRVVLWFDEAIEAQFARVVVATTAGRRIPTLAPVVAAGADNALSVRLAQRLGRGRYTVRWRVLSADSHVQSGEFAFRVTRGDRTRRGAGAPAAAGVGRGSDHTGTGRTIDPAPTAVEPMAAVPGMAAPGPSSWHATRWVATARGVTTAGLLLLVGLMVFWTLAWRTPRPSLAPPDDVQRRFVRRWQRLAFVAVVMTAAATIAGVFVHGAAAAGVGVGAALTVDIVEGVLATGFGKAAVARLVLLEMLATLALLWRVPPLFVARRPARAVGAAALDRGISTDRLLLLAGLVAPLLLSMSMVSHAASATPLGLHLAADVVHLAAAGTWIGGLVVLTLAAFPATRGLYPPERVAVLAPPVVRFSRLAAASVLLVVATGTFRGVATVGGWDALTTTAYGTALLVKLGVFSALLLLGGFNHLWAVRRVRTAAMTGSATPALHALRRSVAVETVLAGVMVVVTAVLVSLPMATA